MHGQPIAPTRDEISARWPHIARFLRTTDTHHITADLPAFMGAENTLPPNELAAAYDEWADFHEWRLTQRLPTLTDDPVTQRLLTQWTDDIAYSYRRCAAYARGEDPGHPIPQKQRRPDLHPHSKAVTANLNAHRQTEEQAKAG